MRPFFTVVIATGVLSLATSSCTDEGSGSSNGSPGAAGATRPADLSAELTFWDTSDPTNEGPVFKDLVARFEERYPKVNITYQSVPFEQAQNKFKTAAETGKGAPDILRAEVAWVPEFASLGYLYALDGTALLEDQSDYLETPMSSNRYEGKTYGVPQVTDALALLYNKELFEKAGITEPPQTWADAEAAATKLNDRTAADGLYLFPGGYFLLPFIYGEGGDLIDPSSQEILVNSDASVRGASIAQNLVRSGAAVEPSASDAYGAMMTLFTEQRVGMIINGPWEVKNIASAPDFGGLDNLGIAPIPAGSAQSGSPTGGHNYVIWSGMPEEKAEAAIAFIAFMNSTDSQVHLAEELGLLPTRKSAWETSTVQRLPTVSAFKPVLDNAVARPWVPEGGLLFGPLDEAAVQILVQGADPAKALDQVAQNYKAEVVPDYDLK